ncbi:IS5 family transposase [Streptomyces sp. NPDC018711]|uniref:IS5 family transposase n=1 Tax=Streptomyces sp. NPDC018711 TaxID=3365052 RepID=UPI0037B00DEE
MPERRRYPSDLSNARWELVEPVLTAWRSERRGRGLDIGRPPDHDLRSLLDAVLYVNRTGIPWRYLPHDYPHWNTVYAYFARWQEEGVFDQLNTLLRRQVRRQEGREEEPTACVIDSHSIKTSVNVPTSEQGIDAGKKIVGRKRSIVIDTVGLLLGVLVTAASVQDSIAGQTLIERVAAEHPTVRKTWVDGGYRQHLVDHAATLGIDMHIVRRDPTTRGFAVLPRRWTVERTLGWLMNHRRLARDYEAHPHRSEAMIHLAMINLMTRRLTAESTPSWRGT